jgi:hypothetical protein
MQFSFEVGEREHHSVEFSFNQMWGNLKITVDGEPVYRDLRTFSLSLVKRYELTVGDEEEHEVVIEHERKLLLAGLRPQKYRVYVDGELVLKREGF